MTTCSLIGSAVMEACSQQQRDYLGPLYAIAWALGYMVLPGIALVVRQWKWLQVALTAPAWPLIGYYL